MQALMESYVPSSQAAGGKAAKSKGATAAAAPPPPPLDDLLGRPLVKSFYDAEAGELRPFQGAVRDSLTYRKKTYYGVLYEDGDKEDLEWPALWPLLQKADEAGLRKPAVAAGRAAAPAPAATQQQQQQQQHRSQQRQQQGAAPAAAARQADSKAQPAEWPQAKGKQPAKKQQQAKGNQQQQEPAERKQAQKRKRNEAPAGSAASGSSGGSAGAASGSSGRKAARAKRVRRPKDERPTCVLPEVPREGTEYVYERGQEPWRSCVGWEWPVNDKPVLSKETVQAVRVSQRHFARIFLQEQPKEAARVAAVKAEHARLRAAGFKGKLKKPSTRPDRSAESIMLNQGLALRGQHVAGHTPGVEVGTRIYSRAELSIIGAHRTPMAGIDYLQKGKAGKGAPAVAISVCISGVYEDDADHHAEGEVVWYTGEGKCAYLANKKQTAAQELERGNTALLTNIQLGIPVRVHRKQKEPRSTLGSSYVYDGLYDVVEWKYGRGKQGFAVYKFRLVRRPGQGQLCTERVSWGAVKAPQSLVPTNRPGVVDLDITRGRDSKPIAAVDDTWLRQGADDSLPQGCLPPCTGLEDVAPERQLTALRGVNEQKIEELKAAGWRRSVEYITHYEHYGAAAEALKAVPRARVPDRLSDNPHKWLKELNSGQLPYNDAGQLWGPRPVVYECCPDQFGCSHGDECPQAMTQRPTKHRLELFKTPSCGWGVRTLDAIPVHTFVSLYVGVVHEAEEHAHLVRTVEEIDAEYTFNLLPRPDVAPDGTPIPPEAQEEQHADFVVCGLSKRNISAFVNHSCQPNLFVQPVLSDHHDRRMCRIAFFASETIAPLTELTLDYGEAFASNLPGGCQCGAVCCISRAPSTSGGSGDAGGSAGAGAAGGAGASGGSGARRSPRSGAAAQPAAEAACSSDKEPSSSMEL